MAQGKKIPPVRDGDLVAYLDGQLESGRRADLETRLARDQTLQARLHALEAGGRSLPEAFDVLLAAAPTERLAARLAPEHRRGRTAAAQGWSIPLRVVLAASLALMLIGGGVGYVIRSMGSMPSFLAGFEQEAEVSEAWKQIIANTLALHTREGLEVMGASSAPSSASLQGIGAKLGINLSPARVAVPGLVLKEAWLLDFHGTPFALLIYLDPDHGAVAFCILANQNRAAQPEGEVLDGMNLVYWKGRGFGFMLMGRTPISRLETLATTLTDRFSRPPA